VLNRGVGRRPRASTTVSAVVFDLGGVLIDWDPRHLYRQLFEDADEMERFLAEVTTAEWNREQDAGRPWADAIALLVAEHPDQRELIEAFHARWPEMLSGAIDETVEVLADVRAARIPVFALSNWSAETFPSARQRFPFLDWFDGIVISGDVGIVKPDPVLYEHLLHRFGLLPEEVVFVDDQVANVETAARLGFTALRFVSASQLRRDLESLGVLPGGLQPSP
jgi:2-haloacid dehalogenase